MPGSVTRDGLVLPISSPVTQGAGAVAGSGTTLDSTQVPYAVLLDENNPAGKVSLLGMAQDGTDSSDGNATQATAGVGIRGWLSTLVSLFRAGTAKVTVSGTPRGTKAFTQVTVGTSATLLLAANASRKAAIVDNNASSGVLYLGKDNTVTTSVGTPLVAGQMLGDDFSSDAWWGITTTGTIDVRVMEAS